MICNYLSHLRCKTVSVLNVPACVNSRRQNSFWSVKKKRSKSNRRHKYLSRTALKIVGSLGQQILGILTSVAKGKKDLWSSGIK